MIVVDTSVWIDHLSKGDSEMAKRLQAGEVFCHPFVIGELACGNLGNREEILKLLRALPQSPKVEDDEVLQFIEGRKLMGKGLGLVDMHLLASCQLSGASIWTRDRRLLEVAALLQLNHQTLS